MGRHARLIVPGVALHIRQRGHNGQDCFRERGDRLVYLAMLRDLCGHLPCALHAYCLMTNHVHLLLTPHDVSACALLMRDLGGCYGSYFNRRYARRGTLWEGRFRSCLVDSAAYVLACYRYIERNPVRAGMVASARDYEWSSYAVNTGAGRDPTLIEHAEYIALAHNELSRRSAYSAFVQTPDEPHFVATMRDALAGGYPLAGDRLKARLEADGARLQRAKPGPPAKADKIITDLSPI
jgi:putative transposase